MPNNNVAENHQRYIERLELYKSFGYDIEEERRFIFEKSKPISGNILEVGTGKGHFAFELARAGHSFISIDVSREEQDIAMLNIEHAGLSDKVIFKIENAEALSFKDSDFDVIFSINTVHHFKEPFKVMDELTRVIKSGGKIVLGDFNKEGFKMMDKIHESQGGRHHASRISLAQVGDYLKDKELKIESHESRFQEMLIGYRK